MKLKFIIFILFFIATHISFSQNKEIDSLQLIINKDKQAVKPDLKKICKLYDNIAMIYWYQGSYSNALNAYYAVLKINEETKNEKGIASSCFNIGIIYQNLKNDSLAMKFYSNSLKLFKKLSNKQGIANASNQIGNIYYTSGNLSESLKNQLEALKLNKETDNKYGIADAYAGIGNIYKDQGNYSESLFNFFEALRIKESIKDEWGVANLYNEIGNVYLKKGENENSKKWFEKGLSLGSKLNAISITVYSYEGLSISSQKLSNYVDAYNNQLLFIKYKDSLINQENVKKSVQQSMQYEFDKKQTADSLKIAEERTINSIKFKQEKQQRYYLYGGLVLLVLFSFFMFNRFKVIQKQSNLITSQKIVVEQQKDLLEEKQKEIIDSITYAKRLQQAILPSHEFIKSNVTDYFVLYKPKDIVAGDFYWAEKVNDLFFIAAADSTGHGVPGAMVSVVCSNALNRSVKEFNLIEPGLILDKTRELVIETFEKSNKEEVKDGMDISLLCIDVKRKIVFWSGANNPLWYFLGNELKEIKADKQPIGKSDNPKKFTTHQIEYETNTTFYLFTDGLADQFGGPNGKKYKYKQFLDLLVKNNKDTLTQQADIIEKKFVDWKGDLEQVDDVCVIGIRI